MTVQSERPLAALIDQAFDRYVEATGNQPMEIRLTRAQEIQLYEEIKPSYTVDKSFNREVTRYRNTPVIVTG